MENVAARIQKILRDSVDETATVCSANDEFALSPFLSGAFNLYRGKALGASLVFVQDVFDENGSAKRLKALVKNIEEPVNVILASATPAEKRKLISAKQGFITKQGDLYLPQLALVLENNEAAKRIPIRKFTPAEQQAFIYCLVSEEPLSQKGLREKTGMSAAGASRALSSLVERGLLDFVLSGKTGRQRNYFVSDKVDFYQRGKKLFGDPVKSAERPLASRPLLC